jgi:hypothetical protein
MIKYCPFDERYRCYIWIDNEVLRYAQQESEELFRSNWNEIVRISKYIAAQNCSSELLFYCICKAAIFRSFLQKISSYNLSYQAKPKNGRNVEISTKKGL